MRRITLEDLRVANDVWRNMPDDSSFADRMEAYDQAVQLEQCYRRQERRIRHKHVTNH